MCVCRKSISKISRCPSPTRKLLRVLIKVTFQPISEAAEATPCSAATCGATATATCTPATPRKSAGPSPRRSATPSRPSLSARSEERVKLPQDSCRNANCQIWWPGSGKLPKFHNLLIAVELVPWLTWAKKCSCTKFRKMSNLGNFPLCDDDEEAAMKPVIPVLYAIRAPLCKRPAAWLANYPCIRSSDNVIFLLLQRLQVAPLWISSQAWDLFYNFQCHFWYLCWERTCRICAHFYAAY